MTRRDHQRIFTALAFFAVLAKGGKSRGADADEIKRLAALTEKFCFDDVDTADDDAVAPVDEAIDRHIEELRLKESTILPDDRATLVKFYERLQTRKLRREQAIFYEQGATSLLANAVLKCLDDEILVPESRTA